MSKINTTINKLVADIKHEKKSSCSNTIQIYFRPCDRELFAVAEDEALMRDHGATSIYSASSRVAARDIAEAAMRRAQQIADEIDEMLEDVK